MDTATVLHLANPEALFLWLPLLVTIAQSEQRRNPRRPQCPFLIPSRVDPIDLPLYARPADSRLFSLYTELPCPWAPFGNRVLTLAVRSRPPDRLHVEIHVSDRFPLTAHEVRWLLEQQFAHDPDEWLPVPKTLRSTALAWTEFSNCWQETSAEDAGCEPYSGAPPLRCNLWLEQQLEQLADPTDHDHLFAEWLQHYINYRGRPPADPRRSFDLAADGRLRHVLERRSLVGHRPTNDS